ncbi:MAG: adenylate/guanylate cyclase domain-containing protein [Pseudomonadota bacterium]
MLIGVFVAIAGRYPGDVLGVIVVLAFMAVGIGYLRLLRSGCERPWHRYLFVTLDVGALAAAALVIPVSVGDDVPQIFVFRSLGMIYLFIVVAGTTLTLMPRLVLWSGLVAVAGIWGVWLTIVSQMPRTISWDDLPAGPTVDEFYAVFLDPDFVGLGNRVLESIVLLSTAALLALAVQRARSVVRAEAQAQRARVRALEVFGQYVPAQVARALLETPERLAPQVHDGTVLFCDVEGFTALAETRPPAETLALLSELFARIGAVVVDEGGVVIGFAGDAVLATFNAPLPCEDHPARALRTGERILDDAAAVDGPRLRLRVGIATGPVAAGAVGGRDRQAYTVYGDTVNVAQRLEAHNKVVGTSLLATTEGWDRAGRPTGYRSLSEEMVVRNRSASVAVVALASRAARTRL